MMVSAKFITTHSGRRIDYNHFTPDDVRIEDIAHALSYVCRFGGHCSRHYSVAEHSLLVAEMVPDEFKLAALLHDASEAYISDIIKPVKNMLPDYQILENKIELVIDEKFNIDWPEEMSRAVHVADIKALFIEARSFYGMVEVRDWEFDPSILKWGESDSRELMCFAPSPTKIKEQFMNAFLAYGGVK